MTTRVSAQAALLGALVGILGTGITVSTQERGESAVGRAPAAKAGGATSRPLPRTADGKPDLQGNWSNATYTPFERPNEFKGREHFTEQEAADYAKRARERFLSQPDDDPHYDNSIWMVEKGVKGVTSLRTSIVVEPADGRLPPVNAEGRRRAEARAAARKQVGLFDSAQSRGLSERCIYWGHEGPPILPTGYNSNVQIAQSPNDFVLITEMMPFARIASLDSKPTVGGPRSLHGTSRGRWEGDTMVIETANFTDRTAFRGSSEHLKVTERLTLVDPDTIRYRFTVEDPHTWDTPWTGEYLMERIAETRFEYACHEGNYGIANILSGQRQEEAKARAR